MPGETWKIILSIVEKLKAEYKPERIVLFGSYAYGQPDENSDIDLLIIKDTDERPIDRRIAVRRLVSGLHNRIPFSPLVLTPVEIERRLTRGDQILAEILNKGETLYVREQLHNS